MAPSKPQKIGEAQQGKSKKVLLGVKGSDVKIWYLGDRRKKRGSSRKQKRKGTKKLSCVKNAKQKCTKKDASSKCKRE